MVEVEGNVEVSIIAPAHDEEDNVDALVKEIVAAMEPIGCDYEIIVVDDGSTDRTLDRLRHLAATEARLRVLRMRETPPGRGHGQSAAFCAAFRAARGEIIAMLDADLQNDPADIPKLLEKMRESGADLVQGDRSHARRDNVVRRCSSVVSRWFRVFLFGDSIRDTACSLRVIRRKVALLLPLQFKGQHRYIPLTARDLGYRVIEMRVNHRPRVAGEAKYGVFDRGFAAIGDVQAVRWMRKRRRPVVADEIDPALEPDDQEGEAKLQRSAVQPKPGGHSV